MLTSAWHSQTLFNLLTLKQLIVSIVFMYSPTCCCYDSQPVILERESWPNHQRTRNEEFLPTKNEFDVCRVALSLFCLANLSYLKPSWLSKMHLDILRS